MSVDRSVASDPLHWSDTVVAHERHWLLAMVIALNTFAPFCFYATTSALEFIAISFPHGAGRVLWITDAYLIAIVCVTPMTGFLLRRLGHRLVLTLSVGGILAAAAAASVAPTMPILIGASFVLGMFVAPVQPATQTLVIAAYPGEHRAMGMALWGAGSTIGVMVGYGAGSVLAEEISWRVMYAPALLLGFVSLLFVRRFAPSHRETHGSIDWLELAAFSAGILGFGALLNIGSDTGWKAPLTYALLLAGALGFAVFAMRYRHEQGRFVNLNVLHDRNLTLAIVIAFGVAATSTGQIETAELGTLLNFSGFFIGIRGALGGVAWLIGVLGGGWLVAHAGARRALLVALLVLLWGRYGYTDYEPGLNMIGALWPNIVTSVGYGLVGTSLAVLAFQNIPKRLSEAASSLYVLGWQLGPALGVAVLNGFVATREADMIAGGVDEMEARILAALDAIWLEFSCALVLVPLVYWFRKRRKDAREPAVS
jgi:MFS transporter, DHA2 family, multidrug resistance protein